MGDIYTSLGHTQHNLHTHTSGFRFALFIQIYYCSDCLNLFNMHDGTSHQFGMSLKGGLTRAGAGL
jgi:hypothetical protein